jgi:hypothetical protein
MDQQSRGLLAHLDPLALLGLAWLGLSVLVGVTVGKAIKAHQESESQDRPESPLPGPRAIRDRPESPSRDRPERLERRALRVNLDPPVL